MVPLVLALGIVVAALGALGIVAPARLLAVARWFVTPIGLYAAAGIRLLGGLAVLLAAAGSRAPGALRVLGIVIVAAGLVTPVIGLDRSRAIYLWWSARGSGFHRAWGAAAVALGLSLSFAVSR